MAFSNAKLIDSSLSVVMAQPYALANGDKIFYETKVITVQIEKSQYRLSDSPSIHVSAKEIFPDQVSLNVAYHRTDGTKVHYGSHQIGVHALPRVPGDTAFLIVFDLDLPPGREQIFRPGPIHVHHEHKVISFSHAKDSNGLRVYRLTDVQKRGNYLDQYQARETWL